MWPVAGNTLLNFHFWFSRRSPKTWLYDDIWGIFSDNSKALDKLNHSMVKHFVRWRFWKWQRRSPRTRETFRFRLYWNEEVNDRTTLWLSGQIQQQARGWTMKIKRWTISFLAVRDWKLVFGIGTLHFVCISRPKVNSFLTMLVC